MNNKNLQVVLEVFLLAAFAFALCGLYVRLRKPTVKSNTRLDYWTGYEQAAAAIISGHKVDKSIKQTEYHDGVRDALNDYAKLAYKTRNDVSKDLAALIERKSFTNQQGTGRIPPRPVSKMVGCRACFGSGGKRASPCKICNGTGKVTKNFLNKT